MNSGTLQIKFVSDLSDARKELERFRAEAQRPLRVGGGGGVAAAGTVRGRAVRGSGVARYGEGRESLLPQRDPYSADIDRYNTGLRRRQQGMLGDVESMSRRMEASAASQARRDEAFAARRTKRVDDNFDRAGLASQKQSERDAERAQQRLAKANERKAAVAERDAARMERQAERSKASEERTATNRARRVDDNFDRAGLAAQRASERDSGRLERRTQRQLATDARQANRLRRASLTADLMSAETPEQRVGVLRDALSRATPGTVEHERLRGQLGAARQQTTMGRFLNRFQGWGAVFTGYTAAVAGWNDYQGRLRADAAGQFGGRDAKLAALEQWAGANPLDQAMIGIGNAANSLGFKNRWAEKSAWYSAMGAQEATRENDSRVQAMIESRGRREDVRQTNAASHLMGIRNDFRARRQAAFDEDAADVMGRLNERRNLNDQIKNLDLNDPQRKLLQIQLNQLERDDPARSKASYSRYQARLGAIDLDEAVGRHLEYGEQGSLRERLERRPREAVMRELEGQYQAEVEGLDPDKDRQIINRRKATLQLRKARVDMDQADDDDRTRLGFDSRKNRLSALMERSPAGAALSDIVGSTRAEMLNFQQRGEKAFAEQSRVQGIDQLKLFAQQYGDSLQGRQLGSKFEIDPQNVGGETPIKVLLRIEKAIVELGGG
jgi:hypothetical protein